jgi:hypothetical protein
MSDRREYQIGSGTIDERSTSDLNVDLLEARIRLVLVQESRRQEQFLVPVLAVIFALNAGVLLKMLLA